MKYNTLILAAALSCGTAHAFFGPSWALPTKPEKVLLREEIFGMASAPTAKNTINGYLFKAPSSNGALVVYGPGCNGTDRNGLTYQADHIKRLHAGGFDVLLLNSIADRGNTQEGGNCFVAVNDKKFVTTQQIARDALAGLAWATKSGYKPEQIVYFGFSHSSRAGLWLAGENTRRIYLREINEGSYLKFAAIALVYPDCSDYGIVRQNAGPLSTPLMVYGGDKDESEPASCKLAFPEQSRQAEYKDRIFPDTYHGYGFPGEKRQTQFGGSGGKKLTSAPNPAAHEETFTGAVEWFKANLK
jgi:hypothetical protein